jgi:membrane protein required for colicin V production
MNWIDIVILCFILLMLILGIKKGLIIGLASFVALVLGIFAAVHLTNWVDKLLTDHLGWSGHWLPVISFAVIFLIVVIAVMLLAKGLEKLLKLVGIGFLNRLFGGIFGILIAIFILSVIIYIFNHADPGEKIIHKSAKENSVTYGYVEKAFPFLMKTFGGTIRFPGK